LLTINSYCYNLLLVIICHQEKARTSNSSNVVLGIALAAVHCALGCVGVGWCYFFIGGGCSGMMALCLKDAFRLHTLTRTVPGTIK
jgi:hypothetical protein